MSRNKTESNRRRAKPQEEKCKDYIYEGASSATCTYSSLVKLPRVGQHNGGLKICILLKDGRSRQWMPIKAIPTCHPARFLSILGRLTAPKRTRKKSQMYIQRYLPHLPPPGEVVIVDRICTTELGSEGDGFLHRQTSSRDS